MSAIPADDVQTSPAWNCDCKGSELFWIVQIKMPFMRFLHKWQGLITLFKYLGQRYRCGLTINYE